MRADDPAPRSAVVCLTARGGHLEHAYNLASALQEETGAPTVLVSRCGAASYLPAAGSGVRLVELPARPSGSGLRHAVGRTLGEARQVRAVLRALPELRLVVLEEPMMVLASALRRSVQVVGMVHNAREHDALDGGVAPLLRQGLKLALVARADRILVHGRRQAAGLPAAAQRKIAVTELPGTGAFEAAQPHAAGTSTLGRACLCLGEIRTNKNYEEAIDAAAAAGLPLEIAGAVVDEEYAAQLRERATRAGADVRWTPDFLSATRFADLLASCRAVVLPYRAFAAQSGVLERALAAGAPVLAAELPPLVEQAGARPGVRFYRPGDVQALAELMRSDGTRPAPALPSEVDPRWRDLARAATGSWPGLVEGADAGERVSAELGPARA